MPKQKHEEETNPLFQLDIVLIFLYQRTGEIFSSDQITECLSKETKADENEIVLMLRKLKNDEYIDTFNLTKYKDIHLLKPTAYEVTGYSINFTGKLFLKQGGYNLEDIRLREQNRKLETLKSDQIKRDEFLKILTTWIAVGAIAGSLYYSIEIYKETHAFFHRHGLYWIWEIIPK